MIVLGTRISWYNLLVLLPLFSHGSFPFLTQSNRKKKQKSMERRRKNWKKNIRTPQDRTEQKYFFFLENLATACDWKSWHPRVECGFSEKWLPLVCLCILVPVFLGSLLSCLASKSEKMRLVCTIKARIPLCFLSAHTSLLIYIYVHTRETGWLFSQRMLD